MDEYSVTKGQCRKTHVFKPVCCTILLSLQGNCCHFKHDKYLYSINWFSSKHSYLGLGLKMLHSLTM